MKIKKIMSDNDYNKLLLQLYYKKRSIGCFTKTYTESIMTYIKDVIISNIDISKEKQYILFDFKKPIDFRVISLDPLRITQYYNFYLNIMPTEDIHTLINDTNFNESILNIKLRFQKGNLTIIQNQEKKTISLIIFPQSPEIYTLVNHSSLMTKFTIPGIEEKSDLQKKLLEKFKIKAENDKDALDNLMIKYHLRPIARKYQNFMVKPRNHFKFTSPQKTFKQKTYNDIKKNKNYSPDSFINDYISVLSSGESDQEEYFSFESSQCNLTNKSKDSEEQESESSYRTEKEIEYNKNEYSDSQKEEKFSPSQSKSSYESQKTNIKLKNLFSKNKIRRRLFLKKRIKKKNPLKIFMSASSERYKRKIIFFIN